MHLLMNLNKDEKSLSDLHNGWSAIDEFRCHKNVLLSDQMRLVLEHFLVVAIFINSEKLIYAAEKFRTK